MQRLAKIEPQDLIAEVKPWETEPWRNFLKEAVVPIQALGEAVAKQFIGDAAGDIAGVTANIAKQVIEAGRKAVGEFEATLKCLEDKQKLVKFFIPEIYRKTLKPLREISISLKRD